MGGGQRQHGSEHSTRLQLLAGQGGEVCAQAGLPVGHFVAGVAQVVAEMRQSFHAAPALLFVNPGYVEHPAVAPGPGVRRILDHQVLTVMGDRNDGRLFQIIGSSARQLAGYVGNLVGFQQFQRAGAAAQDGDGGDAGGMIFRGNLGGGQAGGGHVGRQRVDVQAGD